MFYTYVNNFITNTNYIVNYYKLSDSEVYFIFNGTNESLMSACSSNIVYGLGYQYNYIDSYLNNVTNYYDTSDFVVKMSGACIALTASETYNIKQSLIPDDQAQLNNSLQWVLGSGWTISNGILSRNAPTPTSSAYNLNSLITSCIYFNHSFDILNYSSGLLYVYSHGYYDEFTDLTTCVTTISSNGTYMMSTINYGSNYLLFAAGSSFVGQIDNVYRYGYKIESQYRDIDENILHPYLPIKNNEGKEYKRFIYYPKRQNSASYSVGSRVSIDGSDVRGLWLECITVSGSAPFTSGPSTIIKHSSCIGSTFSDNEIVWQVKGRHCFKGIPITSDKYNYIYIPNNNIGIFNIFNSTLSIFNNSTLDSGNQLFANSFYGNSTISLLSSITHNLLITLSSSISNISGLSFNNDGSKLYINDYGLDVISEYILNPFYNISSASFSASLYIGSKDSLPRGLFFKSDGTEFYFVGSINDRIFKYTMSIPWSITSATFSQQSNVVEGINSTGLFINSDGTKMFISDGTDNGIYQHNMSTPWDLITLNTGSYTFYNLSSYDTNIQNVISAPNNKYFVSGFQTGRILELQFNGIDISSSSILNLFTVSTINSTTPIGLLFNDNGEKLFYGFLNKNIYELYLNNPYSFSQTLSIPYRKQGLSYTTCISRNTLNKDINYTLDLKSSTSGSTLYISIWNGGIQDFSTVGNKNILCTLATDWRTFTITYSGINTSSITLTTLLGGYQNTFSKSASLSGLPNATIYIANQNIDVFDVPRIRNRKGLSSPIINTSSCIGNQYIHLDKNPFYGLSEYQFRMAFTKIGTKSIWNINNIMYCGCISKVFLGYYNNGVIGHIGIYGDQQPNGYPVYVAYDCGILQNNQDYFIGVSYNSNYGTTLSFNGIIVNHTSSTLNLFSSANNEVLRIGGESIYSSTERISSMDMNIKNIEIVKQYGDPNWFTSTIYLAATYSEIIY